MEIGGFWRTKRYEDYSTLMRWFALAPCSQKDLGSKPFLDEGVSVKFASSSCSFKDSLQVLWSPPTVQRLTG